ncbi:MAG: trigger factor [Candidatus Dormibacteraeota bacterium]|nr:trigger factor [Candidatus Dormibacteraeota bacterium]MBV9525859.1 trigger factor [Candidatus Dormibacteraeota bacterium]
MPTATPIAVDVERQPGSQVRLRVEAPAGEVDAAIAEAVRRLASRVRVAGFRPGKAPAAMVERMVGWDAVRQDTIEHLVPDLYRRALDQTGVEPVSDPDLNVDAMEREKPLTFTATVTVRPEVDLRDYHSLRVPFERTDVDDARVDEAIDEVRRRHAELVDVERPAQAGDVLRCTLVMRRGDEVLSGDDSGERDVELDRDSVIPEIVDGIIGMNAGEHRTFDATLPQDYRREELQGATVSIDVTVHGVRERKLPPLDDSLASLDGHGESLEELRAFYRESLVKAAEVSDRERHEQKSLEALRESVRVDVPEVMVENEIARQLNDLEYRLSSIGIPFDKYLEMSGQTVERLRGERRESAVQRVRLDLALDALAAAEGLEVDESQVQREAQRIAAGTRLDGSQRRRLQSLARRDLVRQAAAQRLLEIVGGDDFVQT